MVEKAAWSAPAQVSAVFGFADFLAGNRVVFDIKGNTYRLVAQVLSVLRRVDGIAVRSYVLDPEGV